MCVEPRSVLTDYDEELNSEETLLFNDELNATACSSGFSVELTHRIKAQYNSTKVTLRRNCRATNWAILCYKLRDLLLHMRTTSYDVCLPCPAGIPAAWWKHSGSSSRLLHVSQKEMYSTRTFCHLRRGVKYSKSSNLQILFTLKRHINCCYQGSSARCRMSPIRPLRKCNQAALLIMISIQDGSIG